jgi:hypothetical protein
LFYRLAEASQVGRKDFKMIRSREVTKLLLFLLIWIWAHSCSANQSIQSYVSNDQSRSLGYVSPPTFLLTQESEDSVRVHASGSLKLKSPAKARLLGIFPGVVVHGLGHFYAGADSIGWLLLGAEAAGLGLIGLGAAIEDPELVKVPVYIGTILFLVSWLGDIGMAPDAAKQHNQMLLENLQTDFGFRSEQKNNCIRFQIVKGF